MHDAGAPVTSNVRQQPKIVPNPKLSVAIEHATEVLLKFSVPLYQHDRAGRPSLRGTAFFVRANDRCFLVSAAHVLDYAKNGGLFYYSRPNTLRHLAGRLIRSRGENDRNNDMVDARCSNYPMSRFRRTQRSRSTRWTCHTFGPGFTRALARSTCSLASLAPRPTSIIADEK
jgi:hypothetical protein